jgi:hypothetical protein
MFDSTAFGSSGEIASGNFRVNVLHSGRLGNNTRAPQYLRAVDLAAQVRTFSV